MLSDATNGEVTSAADVSVRGAIILVTSIWDCDLDYPVEGICNDLSLVFIVAHLILNVSAHRM